MQTSSCRLLSSVLQALPFQVPAQAGGTPAQQQHSHEGRPACPLLAFGFGGNVVLFKPKRQQQPAGARHFPSSKLDGTLAHIFVCFGATWIDSSRLPCCCQRLSTYSILQRCSLINKHELASRLVVGELSALCRTEKAWGCCMAACWGEPARGPASDAAPGWLGQKACS